MELREPDEVIDKVGKGELAVDIVQRQVTLFVPVAMMAKVTKGWITWMAQEIYGRSVNKESDVEIQNWNHSVSFGLPPLFDRDRIDYRIALLQRLIQRAYETSEAESEEELMGPILKTKPWVNPSRKPRLAKKPKPTAPINKLQFVEEFDTERTRLLVDVEIVHEIGIREIVRLTEKIYGARELEPFQANQAKIKGNFLVLRLPVALISEDAPPDPRIEELKKLIIVACKRRR